MVASDLFFTPDYPGFASGRILPPRSRLFALEPIALGTPMAEGMISYVVRLANAYSVSPRRLIRREIMKIAPGIEKYGREGLLFQKDARSINGLHQYSKSFSAAIGTLCGLPSARLLTLQSLDDLLPYNAPGLIAVHPRWCPVCYRERLDFHQETYHPLIWSFDLYRVCSRHKCTLLDRCPTCGQFQHVIPNSPIIGFCCHCGTSLAHEASAMCADDHIDLWLAWAIEEIVGALPELTGHTTRACFVTQLNSVVQINFGGNGRRFCNELGLPKNAFRYWVHGNSKPTLAQWLTIAYSLNVGPVEFLKKKFTSDMSAHEVRKLDRKIKHHIRRPPPTKLQHDAVEADLRKQAECGDGLVSVAMIAERHQLGRTYLWRLWPDLYATIRDAYKARLKSLAWEEKCRKERIVREIVDEFIDRGTFPTQGALTVALSRVRVSYADPVVQRMHRQLLAKWKEERNAD
jgi:hypothetical protein